MDNQLVYSFEKKHKALKKTIAQVSTIYINQHKDELDDIIQEILIKVWLNWPRYHMIPENQLQGIVYTITRNYVFNRNKKEKLCLKFYNNYKSHQASYMYHDNVLIEDGLKVYQSALERLTPAQKQVYAFYFDDSDCDEIAKALKITKHTTRNHLRAAIINIKSYLNDKWDLNIALNGRKRWN